ncbi:MAG: metallophosphoesterase family protein [Microcella sp.]
MEPLALPSRVALAGDWHGSRVWVQSVLPSIRRADAEVRDVLHVGDFGLWPADTFLDTVDYWAERTGLRLWVTPGNHDDWDRLEPAFERGKVARVSESVTFLPRGFRFTVGGRTAVSFGGAASHDRAWRLKQRSKHPIWWPQEVATDAEVAATVAGGAADLLITHDAPTTALPAIAAVIDHRSREDAPEDADYVLASTRHIDAVRAAVQPLLHVHGHTHVHDIGDVDTEHGPCRTVALADERRYGNIAVLDADTLEVRVLTKEELRLRW